MGKKLTFVRGCQAMLEHPVIHPRLELKQTLATHVTPKSVVCSLTSNPQLQFQKCSCSVTAIRIFMLEIAYRQNAMHLCFLCFRQRSRLVESTFGFERFFRILIICTLIIFILFTKWTREKTRNARRLTINNILFQLSK